MQRVRRAMILDKSRKKEMSLVGPLGLHQGSFFFIPRKMKTYLKEGIRVDGGWQKEEKMEAICNNVNIKN